MVPLWLQQENCGAYLTWDIMCGMSWLGLPHDSFRWDDMDGMMPQFRLNLGIIFAANTGKFAVNMVTFVLFFFSVKPYRKQPGHYFCSEYGKICGKHGDLCFDFNALVAHHLPSQDSKKKSTWPALAQSYVTLTFAFGGQHDQFAMHSFDRFAHAAVVNGSESVQSVRGLPRGFHTCSLHLHFFSVVPLWFPTHYLCSKKIVGFPIISLVTVVNGCESKCSRPAQGLPYVFSPPSFCVCDGPVWNPVF